MDFAEITEGECSQNTWLPQRINDGKAIAKIVKVQITYDGSIIEEWLGSDLRAAIGSDVEVKWVSTSVNDGDSRIVAMRVMRPSAVVRLD